MADQPIRVLFLCTHNSARSQMAEELLRWLDGEHLDVTSAGTEAGQVHPLAIKVMEEIGIDISAARSRHLDEFIGQQFDYVITVCDRANESCPIFPGDPERIHWSYEDPSTAEGPEEERERAFTRVRNELLLRLRTSTLVAESRLQTDT